MEILECYVSGEQLKKYAGRWLMDRFTSLSIGGHGNVTIYRKIGKIEDAGRGVRIVSHGTSGRTAMYVDARKIIGSPHTMKVVVGE